MGSDAQDMNGPGLDLHHEQDIQAVERWNTYGSVTGGKGIATRGTAVRTARMDDLPLRDFRMTG
jgi:hypothetical protein